MDDKLDFKLLERFAEKTPMISNDQYYDYYWRFTENGFETILFGNKKHGFVVWQTPPPPSFYKIFKEYYPNGILKVTGKRMGGGATMIGEWKYFDEKGQLTTITDEDKKFGKFSYNELLIFLHQQGHINIETGENRERVDFGYNRASKQWEIHITNRFYWITEYVIDGETGDVISKKEYQGGII